MSQDTENLLLERLKNSKSDDDYFRWLLFVVGFYRGINKIEPASSLLNGFLQSSHDVEKKAHCHLALGQIATDEQRFDSALGHFTAALNLHPAKTKVLYVLQNNAAYCLNRLGRFKEGEQYCRRAIEVNWQRASAYRNLGVSLEGQSNFVAAAWAYVEAIRAESADGRAKALLEKLLAEHSDEISNCIWIADALDGEAATPNDARLM